ncbi:MAG: GerMN domain-containing protein [Candidatus Obscuribacterales bacterium]|nr:GerMN domain-containing protein [Candidatus Obscuribacterales bacterium]
MPEISKKIPAMTKHISQATRNLSQDLIPSAAQVWFVRTNKGQMELVGVNRKLAGGNKLDAALKALIDGPNPDEINEGYGSEIPRGTILLGVSEKDGAVEINLSRRFASDGGTDSFETRMEQLSRTVAGTQIKQDVYLNVEGRRLNMTQGEGIEVKQPINR